MNNKSDGPCFCPLEGFMSVISKKWSLLIINALGIYGRLRFNRIMEELHGEDLIEREFFAEIPPRVEYSLTKEGVELRESVIPLLNWVVRRNVASHRAVDCECEECKSKFGSPTMSHTKTPAGRI